MYHSNRGFTLIEAVIFLVLSSIVMSILIIGIDTLVLADKEVKKRNFSDIYLLLEDIERNATLSRDIKSTTNSITITRIDDCTVSYSFKNLTVEKKISNCKNENTYKVGDISYFNVSSTELGDYLITIKKVNENFTRSLIVRSP